MTDSCVVFIYIFYIGQEGVGVADLSPWLDLRVPPKEVKFAGMCFMCDRIVSWGEDISWSISLFAKSFIFCCLFDKLLQQ